MPYSDEYLHTYKQRVDTLQWPDWVINPSLIQIPQKIPNALPRIKDIQEEPRLKISVIIPNYQKHFFLPSIFNQMAIQNFPTDMFEVIVIDDNSPIIEGISLYQIMENIRVKYEDWDISFYQTHKNVTYNIAKAYNIGVKKAKYPLLFNNDADAWQFGNYMKNASKCHAYLEERKMIGAIHPCMITHTSGNEARLQFDLRYAHDTGPVVRREDLFICQGFDESIIGWGGSEESFINRLRDIGVNNKWSADLLIGTSIGTYTWKLMWPPIDPTTVPSPDPLKWGPSRDLSLCNPNPYDWGEIDTLERIF